jgi:gamma-glutamylcyclotransferase (GGCT)/AIG2-like uncharacterized protein YtfP
MAHKLFVYGILRPNHNDIGVIARNIEISAVMVDLDAYPAIAKLGQGTAIGDIVEVDQSILTSYDRIEGVPTLYKRKTIEIPEIGKVFIYVYQHDTTNRKIITEWVEKPLKFSGQSTDK